eukprot:CAMPEP_0194200372 /NCGR_PEP_ID=MMETSP0156-20130528/1005_1 /TAXON_ID=33649 /ORGANISM="Thalassionema nitzschioides, Strain L26-B" /LENGTH=308 /DNA_ID=CAMNT_0038925357 /DNA_START=257 /DNA_END=1183 /DNA_ORIENTATION=+
MSSEASSTLVGKTCLTVKEAIAAHGNVKFLDGSWYLKGRNSRQEFEDGPRIEGADYFDIDDTASTGDDLNPKNLPHMMPPPKLFAAAMDAMGITNDDTIVIYGNKECFFTHRAWFQIRGMGHTKLHLMEGDLSEWIDLNGPIENDKRTTVWAKDLDLSSETKYRAAGPENVVDMERMLEIIKEGESSDSVIVDVRSKERFLGQVEEPRPNMRLGHMPGALNLPFTDLLDPENLTKFKSIQELNKIIQEAGIDIDSSKKIVASCGSGATACTLVLALDLCGRDPGSTFVYDGSWSEWGGENSTPIVKDE